MDAPTIQALTTVAGAAILVAVLVQVFMQTAQPDGPTADRYGPILAIITGIVVVVTATWVIGGATRLDAAQAVVNGIFAGLASMGIHNVVTKTLIPPSA